MNVEDFLLDDADPNVLETSVGIYKDKEGNEQFGIFTIVGHNDEDIADMEGNLDDDSDFEIHEFEVIFTKQNLIDMLAKIQEAEDNE